jgi:hypothetical protein
MHHPDNNYYCRIGISKLQSFTNVQTHKLARHTDSSHPRVLRRRAAVAFTSAHITVRYLSVQRICSPPKSGQLTVRGLAPLKIDSLVGCSPRLPDAGRRLILPPTVRLEISRFPRMERACMPGSSTTPGSHCTCDGAQCDVAFRSLDSVGTQDKNDIVAVAVGTGITSRPPRRSRRAAFPHRAPLGSAT